MFNMIEKLKTLLSFLKEKFTSCNELVGSTYNTIMSVIAIVVVAVVLYKFAKVIFIGICVVMALCIASVLYGKYKNRDERIDD